MIKPTALTLQGEGLLRELKTDCLISEGFDPKGGGIKPVASKFIGLWDTGATGSAISENVINTLGLKPFTYGTATHAGGQSRVEIYMINITLPNGVTISTIPVSGVKLTGTDLLIGMDIIGFGDFAITHFNGKTKMTFSIPSTRNIDFVKEINDGNVSLKNRISGLTKGKK